MSIAREQSRLLGATGYDGSAGPPADMTTLVDIAQWRARHQRSQKAFVYLADGETEEVPMTYSELDRWASAVAEELRARELSGKRVLLVIHPGVEYIAAVFGCLFAGAVAVPVYPPDPFRATQTLPRLYDIAHDAQSSLVLGSEDILQWAREPLQSEYGLRTLAIESIPRESLQWKPVSLQLDQLALLQYTSGTTGTPKGVMLTHANLMHNLRALHQLDTPDAVGICWLPPYHDMGLVGGILLPIFSGRRTMIMSPAAFIQRPARWLRAISRYRATCSGSPDFGYDLCVRKMSDEDCRGLDLSSWKVAVTGAEPVRFETIERFTAKFSPHGFRRETFYPAYGLAEATVLVAGGRPSDPPVERWFSGDLLEKHTVVEAKPCDDGARCLVGSGRPVPETEVTIVDVKTLLQQPAGRVGEIWFRGPNVGAGYWQHPQSTHRTFRARLAGVNQGTYLRTGDLGFIHNGELFVTGRWKELIIVRGRNYYPNDIEQVVRAAHPGLKKSGAAFTVEVDHQDQLVIVHEARRTNAGNAEEVLKCILQELAAHFELTPHCVALVPGGTMPKTSSGKLRRRVVRDRFLQGKLTTLAEWHATRQPAVVPVTADQVNPPKTDVERSIARCFREILDVKNVDRDDDFFSLGGRSIQTAQIMNRISQEFNIDLPLRQFFQQPTVAGLADLIERCRGETQDSPLSMAVNGSPVVPIRRQGSQPPLYAVHPAGGYLFLYYRLAEYLGADQPVHGLQARGLEAGEQPHTSIELMAADYTTAIREVQPAGSFALCGWSFGGLVAFEMARQILRQEQTIGPLILIDPPPVARGKPVTEEQLVAMLNDFMPGPYRLLLGELRRMPPDERQRYFTEQVRIQKMVPPGIKPPQTARMFDVFDAISQAVLDYRPEPIAAEVHVLSASQQLIAWGDQQKQGWTSLAMRGAKFETVPGDHLTMLHEPHIQELATKMRHCLRQTTE